MFRRLLSALLAAALCLAFPSVSAASGRARDELIDAYLAEAKWMVDLAGGRPMRAHYAGDAYVCKNFTVNAFSAVQMDFCMAEFPLVPMAVPRNLPREDCEPFRYGGVWDDVPAEQGNPFVAAASFRYDELLTPEANAEAARAVLQSVRRGDYFQMVASYEYGSGPHSLIFTEDYDAATDAVCWTDSNMSGVRRDGIRYGYAQYGAREDIDWFVRAFCRKGHAATLYRLREDIESADLVSE